ncbi:hypothetical protein ABIE08_003980 [Kaistia defluvii]|uniref:Uncharacterized protein n=2 Tax=Kaistia defluvii TaxID=410841 RepID=A0ABV2R428_9HYPH
METAFVTLSGGEGLFDPWEEAYLELMSSQPKKNGAPERVQEWVLPAAVTLGSSVRAHGILLEMRAKLPSAAKKALSVKGSILILTMPETSAEAFAATAAVVTRVLDGIEALPVIPREIEDILTISTTERHRWLKDGRLQSAGTRTVKLRGRAKKITFHVFDPRHVEDVMDRDLVTVWREDDAAKASENRKRAAGKAALTRSGKGAPKAKPVPSSAARRSREKLPAPKLQGWEEFERDELLR